MLVPELDVKRQWASLLAANNLFIEPSSSPERVKTGVPKIDAAFPAICWESVFALARAFLLSKPSQHVILACSGHLQVALLTQWLSSVSSSQTECPFVKSFLQDGLQWAAAPDGYADMQSFAQQWQEEWYSCPSSPSNPNRDNTPRVTTGKLVFITGPTLLHVAFHGLLRLHEECSAVIFDDVTGAQRQHPYCLLMRYFYWCEAPPQYTTANDDDDLSSQAGQNKVSKYPELRAYGFALADDVLPGLLPATSASSQASFSTDNELEQKATVAKDDSQILAKKAALERVEAWKRDFAGALIQGAAVSEALAQAEAPFKSSSTSSDTVVTKLIWVPRDGFDDNSAALEGLKVLPYWDTEWTDNHGDLAPEERRLFIELPLDLHFSCSPSVLLEHLDWASARGATEVVLVYSPEVHSKLVGQVAAAWTLTSFLRKALAIHENQHQTGEDAPRGDSDGAGDVGMQWAHLKSTWKAFAGSLLDRYVKAHHVSLMTAPSASSIDQWHVWMPKTGALLHPDFAGDILSRAWSAFLQWRQQQQADGEDGDSSKPLATGNYHKQRLRHRTFTCMLFADEDVAREAREQQLQRQVGNADGGSDPALVLPINNALCNASIPKGSPAGTNPLYTNQSSSSSPTPSSSNTDTFKPIDPKKHYVTRIVIPQSLRLAYGSYLRDLPYIDGPLVSCAAGGIGLSRKRAAFLVCKAFLAAGVLDEHLLFSPPLNLINNLGNSNPNPNSNDDPHQYNHDLEEDDDPLLLHNNSTSDFNNSANSLSALADLLPTAPQLQRKSQDLKEYKEQSGQESQRHETQNEDKKGHQHTVYLYHIHVELVAKAVVEEELALRGIKAQNSPATSAPSNLAAKKENNPDGNQKNSTFPPHKRPNAPPKEDEDSNGPSSSASSTLWLTPDSVILQSHSHGHNDDDAGGDDGGCLDDFLGRISVGHWSFAAFALLLTRSRG